MTISGTNPYSPSPLNHWEAALDAGLHGEARALVLFNQHMGLLLEANNLEVVTAIDLHGEIHIDMKVLRRPYPSPISPAGLTAEEHVTLDFASINKYPDNLSIFCVVDYRPKHPTAGVFYITAGRVKEILSEHPERKYSRSARGWKDKVLKVGISTQEMGQITLPGMTRSETAEAFLR